MKFNATEVPKFVILRKNMGLVTQEGKEVLLRHGPQAIENMKFQATVDS